MADWWCLNHQRVEPEEGCGHQYRLGPFDTKQEAEQALDKAKQRNRDWDEQDEAYNRTGE